MQKYIVVYTDPDFRPPNDVRISEKTYSSEEEWKEKSGLPECPVLTLIKESGVKKD